MEDMESAGDWARTAPRGRRQPTNQPRTVVNPDKLIIWMSILTICVMYNLWTLIIRQVFTNVESMASEFWIICDAVSDLVFLLDVGVQLRTGYLEQGLMVYDSKKIAEHYLYSYAFWLDLGALCPFQLLQIKVGPQPLLRFPCFLKVYRAIDYYYMVESRTTWPNLWMNTNILNLVFLLVLWFICLTDSVFLENST